MMIESDNKKRIDEKYVEIIRLQRLLKIWSFFFLLLIFLFLFSVLPLIPLYLISIIETTFNVIFSPALFLLTWILLGLLFFCLMLLFTKKYDYLKAPRESEIRFLKLQQCSKKIKKLLPGQPINNRILKILSEELSNLQEIITQYERFKELRVENKIVEMNKLIEVLKQKIFSFQNLKQNKDMLIDIIDNFSCIYLDTKIEPYRTNMMELLNGITIDHQSIQVTKVEYIVNLTFKSKHTPIRFLTWFIFSFIIFGTIVGIYYISTNTQFSESYIWGLLGLSGVVGVGLSTIKV